VDNSIVSNAGLKFKIVKVYSDLEQWQWKHSFTILQITPAFDKQFYKKFNKYMTNKFGPIDARWSYVKSTSGYFLVRFRTDVDAAYFKLRQ
jgi:hypothetical protein